MTKEQAKANQDRIAKHYNLDWWYATNGHQCCGIYPKIKILNTNRPKDCYLECEVCGKRTDLYSMPWLAEEAWNEGRFTDKCHHLSLF